MVWWLACWTSYLGCWFMSSLCLHVVSLDKKLNTSLHIISLHLDVKMGTGNHNAGGNWTSIKSSGSDNISSCSELQKPELRGGLMGHSLINRLKLCKPLCQFYVGCFARGKHPAYLRILIPLGLHSHEILLVTSLELSHFLLQFKSKSFFKQLHVPLKSQCQLFS